MSNDGLVLELFTLKDTRTPCSFMFQFGARDEDRKILILNRKNMESYRTRKKTQKTTTKNKTKKQNKAIK